MGAQTLDAKKAENTILYIANKMRGCDGCGSTVLNKALFYVDHIAYVHTGKKVTGFGYVKQQRGPTPKPNQFLTIKSRLIKNDLVEEKEVPYYGYTQKRLEPKKEADINAFSPQEVDILNFVVSRLSNSNATVISEFSHQHLCWKLASDMEDIPPQAFLLQVGDLNEDDLQWGKKSVAKYKATSKRN